MNDTISHIAVIGAGMAGITCARALTDAGMHVEVFEKSRGIGGRMSTRRGEEWQCDLGAQYFTARTSAFMGQVDAWLTQGMAAPWHERLAVYEGGAFHIQSERDVVRYVGAPKMNAVLPTSDASFPIHRNTRIESFRQQGETWRLKMASGIEVPHDFDAIVCAVPAPQATPLVAPWSASLGQLASGVEMTPCWAVVAHFDAPLALEFDAAFINSGPLRWIARDNSKPKRPRAETWLIHATPAWSNECLEVTAEEASARLAQAFGDICGVRPVASEAHRWRYADIVAPLNQGAAWDAAAKIGLCGDWLSMGKVEGAWCSGRKLAELILTA